MRRRRLAATASVGIVAIGVLFARGLLRRFAIHEASMEPTLRNGDWVIARRRTRPVERGDIVVYHDPTGSGMNLVKRVIGMPGEHVAIARGRVTIGGALLADRWASGVTRPDGDWVIPDGHLWLLGDNRPASSTYGRTTGPIPIEEVPWIVVARYHPLADAGLVG